MGPGTAFLVLDSGNWKPWLDPECRSLAGFKEVSNTYGRNGSKRRSPTRLLPTSPTVEIGYTYGLHDIGLRCKRAFTKPIHRGPDYDVEHDKAGSATSSIGFTREMIACSTRFGIDVPRVSPSSLITLPPGNRSHRLGGLHLRVEAELGFSAGRNMGPTAGAFLSLRCLHRIGRFSKAGFELITTPTSLHLCLHWSRLGQRISLPLVLADFAYRPGAEMVGFFVTCFLMYVPAVGMLDSYLRQQSKEGAKGKRRARSLDKEAAVQERIGRRRAEADELTAMLAPGAEVRQNMEYQRGGLVILSAKYGVKDALPEDLADVSIAVAALVDGGQLLVPSGLRKSRLLGFWDPAPGRTKVLRVVYAVKGKEYTAESRGREGLSLP
jgi:DnaJ family protein C protein 11